jgi:hypothetical protein
MASIDIDQLGFVLVFVIAVVILDLYFIIKIIKKIIKFYFKEFILSLYISRNYLIKYSFVKKIVEE